MNPQLIIRFIIVTLIVGIAASMALQSLKITHDKPTEVELARTENPLYKEFVQTGRNFGLDMEFTRYAKCHGLSLTPIIDHPLLACKKHSQDIIIFGDSSIAWGIIPEIIEQMTGLQVGIFAFEAFPLNITSVKIIDLVSSYYLKPGGTIILGFSNWFHEQNAHGPIILHADWMYRVAAMTKNEFSYFIEKEIKKTAENGLSIRATIKRNLDFAGYQKQYRKLKEYLGDTLHLSLYNINLYNEHVEPIINPEWHEKKRSMMSQIQCFIRWNNRSVVVRMDNSGVRSLHSETPADPSFSNKNTALVSAAVKKINYRKVFLVTTKHTHDKYRKLRSIYHAYYSDIAELIDLGRAHPRGESYQMDEKEHPINSGSLHQSIILGKELRKLMSLKKH